MAYPILEDVVGDVVYHRAFNEPHDINCYIQRGSEAWQALLTPQERPLYYEVIQLRDGIPIFWDDHMVRLNHTLAAVGFSAGIQQPIATVLERQTCNFLSHPLVNGYFRKNKGPANLKIVISELESVIYLSETYYPTRAQKEAGVPVEVLQWERRDPQVKSINREYKEAVSATFDRYDDRPFEILLADQKGYLAEGSRSNLFFIKGDTVISPPEARILKGITRKYVLEAIKATGLDLREGMLTVADLVAGRADAAFITSSPIDVLAISRIGDHRFDRGTNDTVLSIEAAYRSRLNAAKEADRARFLPGIGRNQNLF